MKLTDPTYEPLAQPNLLQRIGLHFINDPRDLPFVTLIVTSSLVMFPMAIALYIPGVFQWWMAPIYLGINAFVFLDKFILMLHNTSHRPLFKTEYRLLNYYIPWVLSPFFGESPETYFAHHVGMHHPENNLPEDLSSTMRFQRDNAFHFFIYFFRFIFGVQLELAIYLWKKNRGKLLRKMLIGEFGFLTFIGLMTYYVNWQATLVVFAIPLLSVRFLMMAGNWGQHAFIDANAPGNPLLNSLTCINTRYNRRCYNDGYHIGHHVKATRHWTELPGDFWDNREQYAKEGAIVFEGIDFFIVWLLLMFRAYGVLANHFVSLDGKERSKEEIIALLRSRTKAIKVG